MNATAPVAPVFIVGVGRSGTTLLVNLIGSHPLLAPIYETSFLRSLLLLCERAVWFRGDSLTRRVGAIFVERRARARFLAACQKYKAKCEEFRQMALTRPDPEYSRAHGLRQKYEVFPLERQGLLFDMDVLIEEADVFVRAVQVGPRTEKEIYGLAREGTDRLFAMHCARANKPSWVNKTPRLLLNLDLLPKLYPSAKCIHIVRDGRDVAASNLSLSWGPDNVRDAARRWRECLEARKRMNPTQLSYLELHYEDLIEFPEETLKNIFAFLGLSGDTHEMLSQFKIYDQRVGAWRGAFTAEDRRAFAKEAGDLLIELGYEKDYRWVR